MSVSRKLAIYIKEQSNHPTSIDVLTFGIESVINTIVTTMLIFIVGLIFDRPVEILTIAISFAVLRKFTGGAHLKTSMGCSVVTMIVFLLATYVPINTASSVTLTIVSLIVLNKYSYYLEPYQSQRALNNKTLFRNLGYTWICLGFLSIFHNYFYLLALGSFLQCITITPYGIKAIHKLNHLILKGGEK